MSARIDKFSYIVSLVIMLLRGTLYQLMRFRFRGWILLGRGSKILGLGSLTINGIIKIGAYSLLDARFSKGVELGNRFSLGDHSIVRASGSIHFQSAGIRTGSHVTFGPYSNIGGGFGLEIGDDCVFGPYVSIHPEEHEFSNFDEVIRKQGIIGAGITIESNNWFGAKTTILDGARIKSGNVFGAQSLMIRGDYPSNTVYVGSPAKAIKVRVKP